VEDVTSPLLSSPLLPPPPLPHSACSATLCRPLYAGRVPARCFLPPRFTAFRETKRFMKRKAVLRAGIIMLY